MKREDIEYVISEILGEYPLIKEEIRENYMRLKWGVEKRINRFDTIEEYNKFNGDKRRWEDKGDK